MTYQVAFVINFIVCLLLMKVVSASLTPELKKEKLKTFFLTPFLSVRSLRFAIPQHSFTLFQNFFLFTTLGFLMLLVSREFLKPLSYIEIILLSPSVYFASESVGSLGQLIFNHFNKNSFPIHYNPFKSPSLSQFWGRHWNLWVQDWLKDVSHAFKQRSVSQRIFITFFFSGLFHEMMFNFPFWLIYKKSYFGTMMLYFAIQGTGLWVDKKFLKGARPWIKRTYMWLVILLPSPIFISTPFLHFLGLSYG